MTSRALLVMAKRPQAGSTKTRLQPELSAEQAADLYECFLHDVLDTVRALDGVTPLLAVWPDDGDGYFAQHAPDIEVVPQLGASLNERLNHVLTVTLSRFDSVAAINSDSPTLPGGLLDAAFGSIETRGVDAAFGPAEDGGYYLIALQQPRPELILGVTMSTPTVLADTLAKAETEGLNVVVGEPWYDVDTPADLQRLRADLRDPTVAATAPRTATALARRTP